MNKDNQFADKVVWITGASSGIGESLVHEFVNRGATVIASSNDIPGLEKVKAECGNKSMMVNCVPFDLASTSEIDKIVEQQINTFEKIDYLLNIGGISQRARIDETPMWLDRKIFEINFFGTIA
jgi:short-subunit dehydrogenase